MDYIARHYYMDLALALALRLEGRTDREKLKELGWGLPREIRESDSETYFTGGCAHGINGILTNVYPSLPRRFGKSYWGEIFTPLNCSVSSV